MYKERHKAVLYLLMTFFCIACLFDGGSKKQIVGSCYLHQWEGGTPYYVVEGGWGVPDGGGVLEGTVTELCWNEDYIFANRKSTFGGDVNGWMIIDVDRHEVKGPFTNEEFTNRKLELLGDQEMKKYLPGEAWAILK